MNIVDILGQAQGGQAMSNLAKSFGLPPEVAAEAARAITGELAHGIERNTLSRGGIADLVRALASGNHSRYLDPATSVADASLRDDGNAILGHILGSKDKSRAVAAHVSRDTGVAESVVKEMLPAVAALVMGALEKGTHGGLNDILSRIGGTQLPLPGGAETAGGDVGRQQPLPVPGNVPTGGGNRRNPLDDLSDIIRRGGGELPGGGNAGTEVDGGGLGRSVRDILGQILGFENKGTLSYLIKLILIRWAWNFLKRILSRAFLGR